MIFKVAYKRGNKVLIKVQDPSLNEGNAVWMECSEKVYTWCKNQYKDGDEVDVEYTVKDGQYIATRVTKKGQGSKKTGTSSETKDTTSTKNKSSYNSYGEYMKRKHPDEGKQIRALSILSSVCNAVQGLAGHIDPNNIGEVIDTLFDKFDKKLP